MNINGNPDFLTLAQRLSDAVGARLGGQDTQDRASQAAGVVPTRNVRAVDGVPDESVSPVSGISAAALDVRVTDTRSFDLSIQTQEGDTIRLTLSQVYQAQSQYAQVESGAQSLNAERFEQFEGQSLSYTVEGDLDEDEQAAVDDLMKSINEVASQFYSGDVEGAFQQVMDLGYDSDEIARFALDLNQVEVREVTAVYASVAQSQAGQVPVSNKAAVNAVSPLSAGLQSLARFARELIEEAALLEKQTQSVLKSPVEALTSMAAEFLTQKAELAEPMRQFIEGTLQEEDGSDKGDRD